MPDNLVIGKREYLGDGVCVVFDGYHIWVITQRDGQDHLVALEHYTFLALMRFAARIAPAWVEQEGVA